jgi:CheY-like chemotaxis protein
VDRRRAVADGLGQRRYRDTAERYARRGRGRRRAAAAIQARDSESRGGFDEPVDLRGARVLIVDDEVDSLEILRRVLEDSSATVVAARGADEALAAVREQRFDVIVSDIGMPRRDGYEFMRECRSRGVSTPAIALTAFARAEDRSRALSSGYQNHVSKPVATARLVASVKALLA